MFYNNLTGYGHVVQLVGVSSVGGAANMEFGTKLTQFHSPRGSIGYDGGVAATASGISTTSRTCGAGRPRVGPAPIFLVY